MSVGVRRDEGVNGFRKVSTTSGKTAQKLAKTLCVTLHVTYNFWGCFLLILVENWWLFVDFWWLFACFCLIFGGNFRPFFWFWGTGRLSVPDFSRASLFLWCDFTELIQLGLCLRWRGAKTLSFSKICLTSSHTHRHIQQLRTSVDSSACMWSWLSFVMIVMIVIKDFWLRRRGGVDS